jgi:DMSO reductase iron-sulfur subunit
MSKNTHYGMVIDTTHCVGCQSCVISCKLSNEIPGDAFWNSVESLDGERIYQSTGTFPTTTLAFRPRLCNHCANPTCVANCPTGAMRKDETTGIVSVNQDICIGCEYCVWSCPYNAPVLDPDQKVMSKCNFCATLVKDGKDPYCVAACPARARFFGDLSDPTDPINTLIAKKHGLRFMPEHETEPSVYYL